MLLLCNSIMKLEALYLIIFIFNSLSYIQDVAHLLSVNKSMIMRIAWMIQFNNLA